jgi:hypothetical protein
MDSHFVRLHENFSSCNPLITEDVQSMDRKEWLCFIVWNENCLSSAAICLHSSVIVSLVKNKMLLFTATLVCEQLCVFLTCCSVSERPPCYINNCNLQMEHNIFPHVDLSLKTGNLLLNSQ